ncbi:hypothetical protein LTR49_001994 [Elasticomyces elasticus]|nr:hypothetical protein LTR49_001994 [Elasticomyces elasticus]KAK5766763.1 hypothetical protein LTS12_003114 [Elasticomyces elasticus]
MTSAAGACKHQMKLLRSETSLVQFTCSADAKHSTDMVYQCEQCRTKLCSSCVAKAEKKKMPAEREAAGMAWYVYLDAAEQVTDPVQRAALRMACKETMMCWKPGRQADEGHLPRL